MKKIFALLLLSFLFSSVHAQLMATKLIGKNSDRYKLGYGIFSFYDFPLKSEGYYKSVRLELFDFAYYPGKDGNFFNATYGTGYLSIKVGYKVIFSETKTGFYIEPSAGYCSVTNVEEDEDASKKSGYAAALEGGYSIEFGENGHALALGLKFESDRAGTLHTLNSLGFRVSYEFDLFRKRRD